METTHKYINDDSHFPENDNIISSSEYNSRRSNLTKAKDITTTNYKNNDVQNMMLSDIPTNQRENISEELSKVFEKMVYQLDIITTYDLV